MTGRKPLTIGIVGSGPSALYTAQALLSAASTPIAIDMFEAGATAGMGIPYNPATTDPSMLANIASIELPPLGPTLEDWLRTCSEPRLRTMGVDPECIGPRTFFPRIVIGAYFAAGLRRLQTLARDGGHKLAVHTRHRVEDVRTTEQGVEMVARGPSGGLVRYTFAHVVLATGHRAPRAKKAGGDAPTRDPYEVIRSTPLTGRIGILGTSLSAIDVVVAAALRHGSFVRKNDRMHYAPAAGAPPLSLTMMSRGGRLPETDFYCPIPYLPLSVATEDAIEAAIAEGSDGLLDRAFQLFIEELALADPVYADRIGLRTRTADDFAQAYFAERDQTDPFIWARANLQQSRQNAAQEHTVAWKYAILRMHETLALIVPHLNAIDRKRFGAGLKGVFIDNYAAVPPESIERLLALHEAGVLGVVRLGQKYALRVENQAATVVVGQNTHVFDQIIDARGQSALGIDDLPFPSLRLKLKANRLREHAKERQEVSVADTYRLAGGLNPVSGIYFLSLPFLLGQNPFIQGLTSAHEMGGIVAEQILSTTPDAVADDSDLAALQRLRDGIAASAQPLFCLDSGLVVLS